MSLWVALKSFLRVSIQSLKLLLSCTGRKTKNYSAFFLLGNLLFIYLLLFIIYFCHVSWTCNYFNITIYHEKLFSQLIKFTFFRVGSSCFVAVIPHNTDKVIPCSKLLSQIREFDLVPNFKRRDTTLWWTMVSRV